MSGKGQLRCSGDPFCSATAIRGWRGQQLGGPVSGPAVFPIAKPEASCVGKSPPVLQQGASNSKEAEVAARLLKPQCSQL
jgi:hypothetical protein